MEKFARIILVNKAGFEFDAFDARIGTSLWFNIRKRGVAIGASCSGVGVCGQCTVKILEASRENKGEISIELLEAFEITQLEKDNLIKNGHTIPAETLNPQNCCRISCLMRIFSDTKVQADYW